MMKKIFILLIAPVLILVSCSSSINKEYDTIAVKNLDGLCETIGDLNSCSYTLNTIGSKSKGSEQINEHDVYMRGPDKMHVHSTGTKGQRSYFYNGEQFSYFSFNKNNYDTVNTHGNIIAAIDFLHDKYSIDFPAADFFYPTLTDDIINNYDNVLSMADENIDEIDCFVIEASNDNEVVHIWIEKDSNLPHKISIKKTKGSDEYYEAVFSNWKLNPELPDILFEFTPPTNSTRVKLQVKS
jgi:hypothetical protein